MKYQRKMKYFLYRYGGAALLISFMIAFVVVFFIPMSLSWEVRISMLAGIVSFAFLLEKQHLEELHLFVKLFKEFNERYDKLNEGLNDIIIKQDGELLDGEKKILFDYFNLCGEEYLYNKEGYILPEVWCAWKNGMKIFFENPRVKALWDKECNTDSYYGFNPLN